MVRFLLFSCYEPNYFVNWDGKGTFELNKVENWFQTTFWSRIPKFFYDVVTRSYRVGLRNKRYECGRFQTLRYICAHVVAACTSANLNVEQYIDEVYMLERILHIWGNEFLVLRDVSTWKAPPFVFVLLSNLEVYWSNSKYRRGGVLGIRGCWAKHINPQWWLRLLIIITTMRHLLLICVALGP